MRSWIALVALLPFVAPPAGASAPLSYDDARHLLNRTGFGATDAEIERYVGVTREDAARKLLAGARTAAVVPPPAWTSASGSLRYPRGGEKASEAERKTFIQEQLAKGLELRGWWVEEMLTTPSPLTERMTLFWHNHFVSSQQKVRLAELMYRQNVTLARQRARQLRHDAARGRARPGDGDLSRQRAEPQGHAEREFRARGDGALHARRGPLRRAGHQGSRARLHRLEPRPRHGQVRVPALHPRLRQQDRARQDRAISTATTCSTSCSRSPRPRSSSRASCGANSSRPIPMTRRSSASPRVSASSGYDIKAALCALLTSDAFYAPRTAACWSSRRSSSSSARCAHFDMHPARRSRLRSPRPRWGRTCSSPPNVKGWPGGEAWINASTLLARKQFLDRLFAHRRAGACDGEGRSRSWRPSVPKQIATPNAALDEDKSGSCASCARWSAACRACSSTARHGSRELAGAPTTRPALEGRLARAARHRAAGGARTERRAAHRRARARARRRLSAEVTGNGAVA